MSVIREKSSTLFGVVLPRTVAGLAMWILLIGIGMAGSGVAFFAYYQYRTAALEQKIDGFSQQFDADARRRTGEFKALVKDSKAEIEKASRGITRQTNEVAALLGKVAPSIAYVLGQDLAGAPATGSGFIVTSTADETWVITDYRFVAGAAQKKVPVRIRIADKEQDGQVWSWDEARDLALVIVKAGNLPVLEWAAGDPQVGSRIWTVGSSPGKLKAEGASGFVLDSAADGLLVDAHVPDSSLGGPVLNPDGKVLGILTSSYAPVGYSPGKGWAVPVRLSCEKIIKCPAAPPPPGAPPPPAIP